MFSKFTALFILWIALASCGEVPSVSEKPDQGAVSLFTGKAGGTKLSDLVGKPKNEASMPINAILWRAALNTVSVAPLGDVDVFGGTIVTEWFSSGDDKKRQIKITIFILGRELRSDNIEARVHEKISNDEGWVLAGRDTVFEEQIKNLILSEARVLRQKLPDIN